MIEEHKFGSFVIDGRSYLGDIKIVKNKVHYWEDRRGHNINYEHMRSLLESNPEIIIIGTGNSGYLKLPPELKDLVLGRSIRLITDINSKAIEKYNDLVAQNKNVAALFHATC